MNILTAPIGALDEAAMQAARQHNDALAKPLGSLGELENIAIRISGISGRQDNRLEHREIIVFAADNGIYDEGISPVPQAVTGLQAREIARGRSGVGVLAKVLGCCVSVIDIGVKGDAVPGAKHARLLEGTDSFARGPAMSRAVCEQALHIGFEAAVQAAQSGAQAIAGGEMGICNTATSSAVLCALTGAAPEEVVGHGVGLTDELYAKKLDCVRRGLSINAPFGDAVDVLAKLGGLDIAAMAGLYIGCAHARIPAVIDGFIATVAALAAVRIRPEVKPYLFGSHRSQEKGYALAARALDLHAPLDLAMRLGEGSGTPFMLEIMRAACAVQSDMAMLGEVGMSDGELVDIRGDSLGVSK